ncbi:MAG: hypothetical protein IKQ61_04015 [Spirochaetales bacterium]|nr:hypothetical protein [Spirochaetales bacterium]MBR6199417.1 hypothetical protein [Spirochaetales bacterium]
MDLERLQEFYPQVDMSKPHKLHIKVSIDEKDKLIKLSDKIKRTESKICVEAIMTQLPILEERIFDYRSEEFRRKKGDYLFDVDIILPPELFLRLLFYKETFQSFSIGLIVRMMIDDYLAALNEDEEEETVLKAMNDYKTLAADVHRIFFSIKRLLSDVCSNIKVRLQRFSAGLSDEMLMYWETLAVG